MVFQHSLALPTTSLMFPLMFMSWKLTFSLLMSCFFLLKSPPQSGHVVGFIGSVCHKWQESWPFSWNRKHNNKLFKGRSTSSNNSCSLEPFVHFLFSSVNSLCSELSLVYSLKPGWALIVLGNYKVTFKPDKAASQHTTQYCDSLESLQDELPGV